jgi:hypothetical protein
MLSWQRIPLILLVAAGLVSSGCLSIGGKTYSEAPETAARINALEARVGTLERAISGPPVSAPETLGGMY